MCGDYHPYHQRISAKDMANLVMEAENSRAPSPYVATLLIFFPFSVERVEMERPWADVPDVLLSEIFSRLFIVDEAVSCRVCKSWNSASSFMSRKYQFQLENSECPSPHLFMFSNKRIIHPFREQFGRVEFLDAPRTQLRVAKEDWLLFVHGQVDIMPYNFFFFNPFTQETVTLPDLIHEPNSIFLSSPPTSENWVVGLARRTYPSDGIAIDTIKKGEQRWTTRQFIYKKQSFELSYCNAVVYRGCYYFLGEGGELLVHEPKRNKFYFYERPKSLCYNNFMYVQEQYMLESDGKLFAIFVNPEGSWVRVCRWNISGRTWETLESLGNKTFFVSRPFSMSVTVRARGMSNKIFFPRLVDNHCLFYSMSTKRFHTLGGHSFESFHGSKYVPSTTWIKPVGNRLF